MRLQWPILIRDRQRERVHGCVTSRRNDTRIAQEEIFGPVLTVILSSGIWHISGYLYSIQMYKAAGGRNRRVALRAKKFVRKGACDELRLGCG